METGHRATEAPALDQHKSNLVKYAIYDRSFERFWPKGFNVLVIRTDLTSLNVESSKHVQTKSMARNHKSYALELIGIHQCSVLAVHAVPYLCHCFLVQIQDPDCVIVCVSNE